ncbi:unnamed protein product [Lactuca virosa]|uniref:Uncharacterized protein n=1 Tax=Lactuca virosa TaxID=75947 RepID=A0AAU9N1A8_9ASTR|nr:unnamed protein product [Lactuca virosa]
MSLVAFQSLLLFTDSIHRHRLNCLHPSSLFSYSPSLPPTFTTSIAHARLRLKTTSLPIVPSGSSPSSPIDTSSPSLADGSNFDAKVFRHNLTRIDNYNRKAFGHKKETLHLMNQEYTIKQGIYVMDELLVGVHQELWGLFNFCCPELLGDKKCFKEKYESAILRGNDKNASDRDKRIGSIVAQRQLYEGFLNSEIVLSAFDGSPLAALTLY